MCDQTINRFKNPLLRFSYNNRSSNHPRNKKITFIKMMKFLGKIHIYKSLHVSYVTKPKKSPNINSDFEFILYLNLLIFKTNTEIW